MRRRHPIVLGTVVALIALAAAVGAGAAVRAFDDDEPEIEPEVELSFSDEDDESGVDDLIGGEATGDAAPDIPLPLLDGGTTTFADFRGTPLVVNFFASWCAPCVEEMPAFEDVHQALGDEVAFLGIDLRDSESAARELVEETGVTYTIARDPSGEVFAALEGINMPTTILIDAGGTIVESHPGALDADQLRRLIETRLLT